MAEGGVGGSSGGGTGVLPPPSAFLKPQTDRLLKDAYSDGVVYYYSILFFICK